MTVVLDGDLSWPPPVQVSAAPAAPAAPEAALAGGVNNFLLREPDPLRLSGDRYVLVVVEDHLRPERRVPGHLDRRAPERPVYDVEVVVVDVLAFLLQAGDGPRAERCAFHTLAGAIAAKIMNTPRPTA